MSVVSIGSIQATFCATLVDEWIRSGVTDAVVAPGSRSTPMTLAVAARPELATHVRLDERSAGFIAVGLARASGRPTIVVVTSGTAVAELHASLCEADLSGVSLIVVSCDRPPELQGVGAPQTIEQTGIFAASVREAFHPGVPSLDAAATWRPLGARVFAACTTGPRGCGPVQLNLAFREPLVDAVLALPKGRPDGRPWRSDHHGVVTTSFVEALTGRGIIIAGAGAPAGLPTIARAINWPILADPRSNLRHDEDDLLVTTADTFLRHEPTASALFPEVILLVGEPWASKVLALFVQQASAAGATVVVATDRPIVGDPQGVADIAVRCAPGGLETLCGSLLATEPAPETWLAAWQRAERCTRRIIDVHVNAGHLDEPSLAAHVARRASDLDLVVSSSMPIRDLEWFGPATIGKRGGRVFSNRGANGIDGVVSTAIGTALAGRSTVLLIGDLAFLHDCSALVDGLGDSAANLTIVVAHNGGGGIFSFLSQASTLEEDLFSALFTTPPRVDVARVAEGFGVRTGRVGSAVELERALEEAIGAEGIDVVVVDLPSVSDNVSVHNALISAVCESLDALG